MSTFQDAFSKHTSSLSSGDAVALPRRQVTFDLDADVCSPGVFGEDMKITLRSLTAAQEMRVAATDSMIVMAMNSARESLWMVDGVALGIAEKEWFWEAIGPGGRQIVMTQYPSVVGDTSAAKGKAEKSLTITG